MQVRLARNQLGVLPAGLGNLQRLQILDLHRNLLRDPPLALTRLQTLRELFLSANQLTTFPIAVGRLHALERLSISENQIESLDLKTLAKTLLDTAERLGQLTPTAIMLGRASLDEGLLPNEIGLSWAEEW